MKKVMRLVLPMILVVCAGILNDGPILKPLALNVAVRLSLMYIHDYAFVIDTNKLAKSQPYLRAIMIIVGGIWLAGFVVNIITVWWATTGGAT